jgi:hypothetical protein
MMPERPSTARRAVPPAQRYTRLIVLALLAVVLVEMALRPGGGGFLPIDSETLRGIALGLAVGLLALAILRFRMNR